ncbi:MAG: hypothetical protein J1G38_01210 [Clostridiales bacterium]|nr:hypothetical protein [Clostridiales bacterium]
MGIGQKFKSMWNKLRNKSNGNDERRKKTDAEISAEEVIEEEIYPAGKITTKRKREIENNEKTTNCSSGRKTRTRPDNSGNTERVCGKADVTPTARAGRSRPTNPGYKMIDRSDDSADSSKS